MNMFWSRFRFNLLSENNNNEVTRSMRKRPKIQKPFKYLFGFIPPHWNGSRSVRNGRKNEHLTECVALTRHRIRLAHKWQKQRAPASWFNLLWFHPVRFAFVLKLKPKKVIKIRVSKYFGSFFSFLSPGHLLGSFNWIYMEFYFSLSVTTTLNDFTFYNIFIFPETYILDSSVRGKILLCNSFTFSKHL